jgi:hypothetical protein
MNSRSPADLFSLRVSGDSPSAASRVSLDLFSSHSLTRSCNWKVRL